MTTGSKRVTQSPPMRMHAHTRGTEKYDHTNTQMYMNIFRHKSAQKEVKKDKKFK